MPKAGTSKRTHWRATVRVVAVLFLLFACADLAFPEICSEDNARLLPQQTATTSFPHGDDSGEPQPHRSSTEDCFCCCSHIVSSSFESSLGALAILSSSDPGVAPSIPLAPLQLLFHPPRLA